MIRLANLKFARICGMESVQFGEHLLVFCSVVMANTHMLREASWSESQNMPQFSSSSSSGYSTEDSGDLEPDFIIPRQGPVLEFSASYINMQRDFWRNCLIGVLVDDNMVKASRLQNIINRVWNLQHPVRVVGRSKNVFAFEFGCDLDKEIIHHEGPWAIQNKFLVMQSWQPNLILKKHTLNSVPVWVEFWGFPLEYYTSDIAELVGSMVGTVLQVDFSDQGFRNLRYLRVKVEVDRSIPLLMGFYVLLDDDRTIWIQCRYERMFRICRQCGCIGHVAKDCKKTRRRAQAAVKAQKEALRQRFDTVSFMDLESPLFVNEAMAFRKRRSSSSSSSSSPGSNMYRVSDDSSSGTDGSSSYSSPPSQSEHVNVVDDQMEDEEDPLTPEGYYSDPIGQGSQGGVASNSPHLTNVNDPLTPQSPINWELIAAKSTHWQPTSEGGTQSEWRQEAENRNEMFFGLGDELQVLVESALPAPVPSEGGPQEQLLHQVNPDSVQNTYSVDAAAQVQVEDVDISSHRVHMQNQDMPDADASSSLFPHASGLDVPPHVWSELIQSLFTLGLNQEAHFNPFLLWPSSTLTVKAQCLLARWISRFLPLTVTLGLLAQLFQKLKSVKENVGGLAFQPLLSLKWFTNTSSGPFSLNRFIILSWAAFLLQHWASLRNINLTCSHSSPPSLKRRLPFPDTSVIKRLRSHDVVRPKTFHRITFTEPTGPVMKKPRHASSLSSDDRRVHVGAVPDQPPHVA
ncbi:Pyruvate carboxyltransferase [Senna tora]|uniref:Pyruvate carboxyltransferase n=1 Tax=Senna tora TaxID=362788 RepID=A0A834STI5_9FABA|nr:Pyruvate carboxyltransferase [Senna tora]